MKEPLLDWTLSTRNDYDGIMAHLTLSTATIRTIIKALLIQSNNKRLGELLLEFYCDNRRESKEWASVELSRTKKKINFKLGRLKCLNNHTTSTS